MVKKAITLWLDESTGLKINGKEYNLIGYLITNSDKEEFCFLNELRQARKGPPSCWVTIHANSIRKNDLRKINLIRRWLRIFSQNSQVFFHVFLYSVRREFISPRKGYEFYFAKQAVFSLSNKMKSKGVSIQTLFSDVGTLTIFFDRRRAISISSKTKRKGNQVHISNLEDLYQQAISEQIRTISGKNSKQNNFTIRLSFVNSACFDAMQLTDVMLYMVRQKLEQKNTIFTEIFDDIFLNSFPNNVKNLGFEKIYNYEKKFNFFRSD